MLNIEGMGCGVVNRSFLWRNAEIAKLIVNSLQEVHDRLRSLPITPLDLGLRQDQREEYHKRLQLML